MAQTNDTPQGEKPPATLSGVPVYAAGVAVAGMLLLAAGGITYQAVEGKGMFADDTQVVAGSEYGEPGDGIAPMPDKNNNDIPDILEDDDDGRDLGDKPTEESPKGDEGDEGETEEQEEADPGPETYIIETGDTLTSISAETGVPVDLLVSQNGIQNPNLIYAGSALLIPQV